jgi:hypothetical protein
LLYSLIYNESSMLGQEKRAAIFLRNLKLRVERGLYAVLLLNRKSERIPRPGLSGLHGSSNEKASARPREWTRGCEGESW